MLFTHFYDTGIGSEMRNINAMLLSIITVKEDYRHIVANYGNFYNGLTHKVLHMACLVFAKHVKFFQLPFWKSKK
jgi:hypothetical protein